MIIFDHVPLLIQRHHAARAVDPLLLGFIDGDHTAPAVFRGVTGDIGLRHHFRCLIISVVNQRDPRAGADAVQASFPGKMIVVDGVDQPARNIACAFDVAVRQQQAKLVAAQTRQHVAGAQHGQHQRREFAQERVARRVACGIVHRLKTVKIDKDQRVTLMGLLYRLQQALKMVFKTDAVRQVGKGVMGSAVAQLAQHFARLGDILNHQHRADSVPLRVLSGVML